MPACQTSEPIEKQYISIDDDGCCPRERERERESESESESE
jgi:hypothetical protein